MERLDLYRIKETVSVARDTYYHLLSPRSTELIFQIINMLVDITATVCYLSMCGFTLIPLPCVATLWNAQRVEEWWTEFKQYYEERTLYGISNVGGLTRIHKDDAGIHISVAEWEEWAAQASDIGTLVMIVGELL